MDTRRGTGAIYETNKRRTMTLNCYDVYFSHKVKNKEYRMNIKRTVLTTDAISALQLALTNSLEEIVIHSAQHRGEIDFIDPKLKIGLR